MSEETVIFIYNAGKTKIIFREVLVQLGAVLRVVRHKNMCCEGVMCEFGLGH
jgi:hypothetical protein